MNAPFAYSRGRNVNDAHPQPRTAGDFAAFVAALDADRAPRKSDAAYVCGPLNGDGRRCAEGAEPRRWLALDFDRVESEAWPRLREWFGARSGCAWPTHSSKPEAPRERVIIELDRDATRAECLQVGAVLARDLAAEFGDAIDLDESTARGEQPVFVPPAGVQIARFLGEALPVDAYLEAARELPQDAPDRPRSAERGGDLLERIERGEGLHEAVLALVARLAARGVDRETIEAAALGVLERARRVRGARVDALAGAELGRMIDGAARKFAGGAKPNGAAAQPGDAADGDAPRVLPAAEFLREFRPIESIVDGLPLARGGLISITGPTGHGKTTVSALLQFAIATGARFAGREVTRGAVLVLSGENPNDYAMHLLATLQDAGSAGVPQNLLVVPGAFDLVAHREHLDRRMQACGVAELVAVFVDTSAAFNLAGDENDNVQQHMHAVALRELTQLPGRPCVMVLCHPTKHATKDNLLPRGGGSFLAQVDGNLTLWRDDAGTVTLHWAGKIRGASFEPVRFELVPLDLRGLLDCRERPIYSTAARAMDDDRAEQLQEKAASDDDRLLVAMQKHPGASLRELARACGWVDGKGGPQGSRVSRRLHVLEHDRLTEKDRKGQWKLTAKGQKEADRLPS